jgi:bifunctional DNA-binding transcriptional regulator/antitoxin component of YhaV-PrlF toxin-antitoxin module
MSKKKKPIGSGTPQQVLRPDPILATTPTSPTPTLLTTPATTSLTPATPSQNEGREWMRVARKTGKSLSIVIPSELRRSMGIFEGALILIRREGETLVCRRLKRLETTDPNYPVKYLPPPPVGWERREEWRRAGDREIPSLPPHKP